MTLSGPAGARHRWSRRPDYDLRYLRDGQAARTCGAAAFVQLVKHSLESPPKPNGPRADWMENGPRAGWMEKGSADPIGTVENDAKRHETGLGRRAPAKRKLLNFGN